MFLRFLKTTILVLLSTTVLSGCGAGLCVGGSGHGGCLSGTSTPSLLLSGLSGLTIRKNDCYPVTLSAVDAAGNAMTNVNASVSISASSGVVLYSSLAGCQTYDSAFERSTYTLDPSNPQVVFYFRSDTEGTVSLNASTSASVGLADVTQALSVEYTDFNYSNGPNAAVSAILRTPSDQYYVGGSFNLFDQQKGSIVRTSSSGDLDTSFIPANSGLGESTMALALQTDGKLLAAGVTWSPSYRGVIARYNTDGSIDSSFAPVGTGLSGSITSMAIQTDGKIIVGGGFTSYNGTARSYVARLNTDGSLDTSFVQTGSGLNSSVDSLVIQSDGRIVLGGAFGSYNGASRGYVARLNTNGSLDGTFVPSGSSFNYPVYSVALQSDGKILVGGGFASFNGTARVAIARLNTSGSLDTTYVPNCWASSSFHSVFSIYVDPGGFVTAGGWYYDSPNNVYRSLLCRTDSLGTSDPTFLQSNFDSRISAIAVTPDNGLLLGGAFASYDGAPWSSLAKINSDGSLANGFFGYSSGFNSFVSGLALQPDGKLLAVGRFDQYRGVSASKVARLNADGSRDTSFTILGTGFSYDAYQVAVQSDGKILVAGGFNSFNGTFVGSITRLLANGGRDPSFNQTGTGIDDEIHELLLQPDGKILVAGQVWGYNGTSRNGIARLNTDGSLDTGFVCAGSQLDDYVEALALQTDGKIVIGGDFTDYNGTTRTRIARLNAGGSLDTGFISTGVGFSARVDALQVQTDGKILVGGSFSSFNGTTTNGIARLNADGSLDPSFVVGTGFGSGAVESLSLQTNGQILVGGGFQSYNGTSRAKIARLNSDGSLDSTFLQSAVGFDSAVRTIKQGENGKIFVGGWFTSFGASSAMYLARLTYIGGID